VRLNCCARGSVQSMGWLSPIWLSIMWGGCNSPSLTRPLCLVWSFAESHGGSRSQSGVAARRLEARESTYTCLKHRHLPQELTLAHFGLEKAYLARRFDIQL